MNFIFFSFYPDLYSGYFYPPSWFSINKSVFVKVVNWHFVALTNFSLETFMLNLVSLTCPSLQILVTTQSGVFSFFGFLPKYLTNKRCHDCRSINKINMKRRLVTKLDKRNTTTSEAHPD